MDMICYSTDLERFHFILACDAAQKWPKAIA
jgi:hypothetical protein